ncbi:MAG: response regulator [Rhodobacteraceae bacterium]|nr:response regulator [Paracoccaceae bacterium]
MLRLLLVEDDEDDYLITSELLEELPYPVDLTWVESYDKGFEHLDQHSCDVCFVDYRIGGQTGLEFIAAAKAKNIFTPLILLTGVGQRDIDIAATEAGAADFLDKSELTGDMLERSIRYSVAHARALQALSEQSSLLETTLEHTGAGIGAVDREGRIITSNADFQVFLGAFERSENAASAGEGGGAETASLLLELLSRIEASTTGYIEYIGDQGRVFEARSNATPRGDAVLFIVDITGQKKLQTDLLRAQRETEATSRAKSSFLATVSHELRTPLNAVIGFSEVLMISADDPEMIKEYAGEIRSGGHNLLKMVNNIIFYSQIESGEYSFEKDSECYLEEVAAQAKRDVGDDISSKSIEVSIAIDPKIEYVRFDEISLRRIVANLLSNAVKFSLPSAKVEIDMAMATDGGARISVRDWGDGMSADQIAEAFNPFCRGQARLDRSHDGLGLGLPIAGTLAESHQCSIKLESAPENGVTAVLIMPPDRVARAPSSSASVG